MKKSIRPKSSFLTQRKTKTQKIIARILMEEPDEAHKPSTGEGQGNLKLNETAPRKGSPRKGFPKRFDIETIPKEGESIKSTETPLGKPLPASEVPILPEEDGMNDGFIKVWRKIRQSRVWENPRLLKVFLWCLLRANYKESWVTVKTGRGTTEVKLSPGEFIFGRNTAARELRMKPSSVRNFIVKLRNLKNLDLKQDTQEDTQQYGRQDSHYSIISITNWQIYQVTLKKLDNQQGGKQDTQQDREEDRQRTGKGHREEGKESKEENSSAIFTEISSLISKLLPGEESLWQEALKAISSTRKGGKVAPSVILSFLQSLQKYPLEKIRAGVQIYLSRECWREGKDEKYLRGIIREESRRAAGQSQEGKSRALAPGNVPEEKEDPAAARRREMALVEAVECPENLRPAFVQEGQA